MTQEEEEDCKFLYRRTAETPKDKADRAICRTASGWKCWHSRSSSQQAGDGAQNVEWRWSEQREVHAHGKSHSFMQKLRSVVGYS